MRRGVTKITHQERRIEEIRNHIEKVSSLIKDIDRKEDIVEYELSYRKVLINILNDYQTELTWTIGEEWLAIQRMKERFEFYDERIILREPREEDKEFFLKSLGNPDHLEHGDFIWRSIFADKNWFCSIIDQSSKKYVGYVEIKDMAKPLWEIGITILPAYRHQGYGTHSITLFTSRLSEMTQQNEFQLKVMADNTESQGLMEKIGAKLVGITSMPTIYGINEESAETHTEWITSNIEKLAVVLMIAPKKLLSHPLDYRINIH